MLPVFARCAVELNRRICCRKPAARSTSSNRMKDETAEVKRTVEDLPTSQLAIAQSGKRRRKLFDPGHWNDTSPEYCRERNERSSRCRVFALLTWKTMPRSVLGSKVILFQSATVSAGSKLSRPDGLPNFQCTLPATRPSPRRRAGDCVGSRGLHVLPRCAKRTGSPDLWGHHYPSDITPERLRLHRRLQIDLCTERRRP